MSPIVAHVLCNIFGFPNISAMTNTKMNMLLSLSGIILGLSLLQVDLIQGWD